MAPGSDESRPSHTNRVGGAPRPALEGAVFEAGGQRWPRSGPRDVAAALEELRGRAAVTVVRRSWSEGAAPLRALVEQQLAEGRGVLVLADGRAPEVAVEATRDLSQEGLALLFDDGDVALRAALGSPRVDRVLLSGHQDDAARLEPLLARSPAGQGFGAGVVEAREREVRLDRVGPRVVEVGLDQDPEVSARDVLDRAWGARALGGEAAHQVGRVRVHPRRLSRFTAALLAALEDGGAPDPHFDPVERDLGAFLERARGLGLDEGATLIHEARVGSPRSGGSGRIARLVFTNVEPRMQFWGLARPAPLLLLARLTDRDPA